MEPLKLSELGGKSSHNIPTIVTLLLSVVVYVVAVIFNGLNGSGKLVPELFFSNQVNLSAKYDLPITPAVVSRNSG